VRMTGLCSISLFTYVMFLSALVISHMSRFCNYVRAAQIEEEKIAANHQEAKIANKQNAFSRFHICHIFSTQVISRMSCFCNYVRAAQIDEEMIAANHQEAKIAVSRISRFFHHYSFHVFVTMYILLLKSRPNR